MTQKAPVIDSVSRVKQAIEVLDQALSLYYDGEERVAEISYDDWKTIQMHIEELRGWCDDLEYWSAPESEGIAAVTHETTIEREVAAERGVECQH